MRVTKQVTGLVAAGMFAFGGTFAQAALIDSFNFGEVDITADEAGERVESDEAGLEEVIGGRRQVILRLSPDADPQDEVGVRVNVDDSGTADLLSGPGAVGSFRFLYQGGDEGSDGEDLNADLTDGGVSDRFFIDFIVADAENAITINVEDGTGATGSASEFVTGPGGFFIEFDDFTGALDFSDVANLNINFDGANSGDYTVDFFTTAIPTPAALPGGLAILGVMGLMRRRRRA